MVVKCGGHGCGKLGDLFLLYPFGILIYAIFITYYIIFFSTMLISCPDGVLLSHNANYTLSVGIPVDVFKNLSHIIVADFCVLLLKQHFLTFLLYPLRGVETKYH